MQPIIIAGFGRSGTTWVSDIISKTLGGLILFEPDHPCVFPTSKDFIYSAHLDAQAIAQHFNDIINKEQIDPWLLRNHLINGSKPSEELVRLIWQNTPTIGFKSIRWNHGVPTLASVSNQKLIYIIRHPLAVVASLLHREGFFLELGWDEHWMLFKKRNPFNQIDLSQYDQKSTAVKYGVMWAITNIKALADLADLGLPYWAYEKLYQIPYDTSKQMLNYLGYKQVNIHPSYLFYPSMSTLKTFHTDSEKWPRKKDNLDLFYKDLIDQKNRKEILITIEEIVKRFPCSYKIFKELNYLNP